MMREKYPILGHESISSLTLEEIIRSSHENITRSMRGNQQGLLNKFIELWHGFKQEIYEAAQEHVEEDEQIEFIQYRMNQSKRITLLKLADYLIDKQMDKVMRRACVGSKLIIVRKSLENSIRPVLAALIEEMLISACEN